MDSVLNGGTPCRWSLLFKRNSDKLKIKKATPKRVAFFISFYVLNQGSPQQEQKSRRHKGGKKGEESLLLSRP